VETTFHTALDAAKAGLVEAVKANGNGSTYAVLSPMMACEEAWLLGKAIRALDPEAVLALGPVPTTGENEIFKNSMNGKQTFVIQAEKVPNAAGIRRVLALLGGAQAPLVDLEKMQNLKAGWIVGGYLSDWMGANLPALPRGFKVVQDILPNKLTSAADVILPAAAWAEKEGCWENYNGKIQPFSAAIAPPESTRREGDVYLNLLQRRELYNAASIRQEMGDVFAAIALPAEKHTEPAFEFVEL
jgi:NADH-quinone oxidoreductase subunit G